MIIEDGKGKGYSASVSPNGELRTISPIVRPLHYYSSEYGKAYQITTGPFSGITTDTGFLLWGKNTDPSQTLHVSEMHITWDGGSTSGNDTLYYQIYVGTGTPSGNYIQPMSNGGHSGNMNLASIVPPEFDLRQWDEAGSGITVPDNGSMFITEMIPGKGTRIENWEGGLLMPPNSILALSANTASETGQLSLTMYGWFSDEHIHA